jgi:phosphoribosylformimino-5-aminoimidazole carboxamide ribotide isomerase
MIIFPAIDLKQGKCVRLFKGDMNQATIFNENPLLQAKEFEEFGFKFLHIVDLDGAIEGFSVNEKIVSQIVKNIKIPVQLGGGIRSIKSIEKWLESGISRVILGTIALKNPQIVFEACKKFPNKIVVGIDAKNNMVATEGWVKTSTVSTLDLAKKFEDYGVSAIIYTDILKDGTLSGCDLSGTKNLAENTSIPIIASGGISSFEDALEVKKLEQFGVIGAIIGRAIYDKKIDPKKLVNL